MTATSLWARRRRVRWCICLLVCYWPLALSSSERRLCGAFHLLSVAAKGSQLLLSTTAVLYRYALRFYPVGHLESKLLQVPTL